MQNANRMQTFNTCLCKTCVQDAHICGQLGVPFSRWLPVGGQTATGKRSLENKGTCWSWSLVSLVFTGSSGCTTPLKKMIKYRRYTPCLACLFMASLSLAMQRRKHLTRALHGGGVCFFHDMHGRSILRHTLRGSPYDVQALCPTPPFCFSLPCNSLSGSRNQRVLCTATMMQSVLFF